MRRGRAVRAGAIATALGDAGIVAAICSCTGRAARATSTAYFYLTQIAASIRFGAGAAFAMLAVNARSRPRCSRLARREPPADLVALRLFYLFVRDAARLGAVAPRAARTCAAARAARDRAQNSLRRLIGAEEEERKRIAGELHDRMGARFFELYYGIDRCARRDRRRRPRGEGSSRGLGADARACGDEIRELMNELRPSVLDDFGVSEALREYGAALQEQGEPRGARSRSTPRPSAARPR